MASDYSTLSAAERAGLALRERYERMGYRKYRMGQFEEYSLYMDNRNFLSSERVISFTDLDGRLLALRPDVTLRIVRHASEQPHAAERLYYTESVYRPSAESHAFQEISQMGIEYIGTIDRYATVSYTHLDVYKRQGYRNPSRRLLRLRRRNRRIPRSKAIQAIRSRIIKIGRAHV